MSEVPLWFKLLVGYATFSVLYLIVDIARCLWVMLRKSKPLTVETRFTYEPHTLKIGEIVCDGGIVTQKDGKWVSRWRL